MFNIKQVTGQLFLVLGMAAHGAFLDAETFYGGASQATGLPLAAAPMMADEGGFEVVSWGNLLVAGREPDAHSQLLSALDGAPDLIMDYQHFFLPTQNLLTLHEDNVQSILAESRENFVPQQEYLPLLNADNIGAGMEEHAVDSAPRASASFQQEKIPTTGFRPTAEYRAMLKEAREGIQEAARHNPDVRQAYERILQEGQEKANRIQEQASRARQSRKADKAAGIPVKDAKEFRRDLNILYSRAGRVRRQDKAIRDLYLRFCEEK